MLFLGGVYIEKWERVVVVRGAFGRGTEVVSIGEVETSGGIRHSGFLSG